MTSVLAAADLDGTLIFSAAAAGTADGSSGEPPPGHDNLRHPVEEIGGAGSAWVLDRAVDDLRALARSGSMVPATTRSLAQYERLMLPGPRPRWSIVANGGQLLRDGEPQPWWEQRVRSLIAAESVPAAEVLDHLRPLVDRAWVRMTRNVDEMFSYLVATARHAVPPDEIDALVKWGTPLGLEISFQGRKIYLVPRSLTKQAAMSAVVDAVGAEGFVAAGDSLLDAGLLDAATLGIRPAHGELESQNWQRPHVIVTSTTGMAAGAEIASWLRSRLSL